MKRMTESKALLEVREWKAACARDVEGLGIGEAVRKRLKDAEANARKAGFVPTERRVDCVAAVGEPYRVNQR